MPVVSWDNEGLPHSTLYPDIYRSRGRIGDRGLEQARHVFLEGCRLRGDQAVWKRQPGWCVLENGFGLGLNFLATWQAWQQDPDRPTRLHYIATESHPVDPEDLIRSTRAWPELHDLARQLALSWWGLLPGVHRLSFDSGAVVLDLVVGDSATSLTQLDFQAHSVYLDGFSPRANPGMWSADVLRELTRLSRRGAYWATWCVASAVTSTLVSLGLQVIKRPGLPPKKKCLQALWPGIADDLHPSLVCVLGAGLAGASVARALAERGWPVRVIDAIGPAAGASGLPAGLVACHTSGDDQALSRLTRMGLRHTLSRLKQLRPGQDWGTEGLDEMLLGAKASRQPPEDHALSKGWQPSDTDLSPWRADWWQDIPGGWHQPHAAWVQPRALVRHLLDHPVIETMAGWDITGIQRQAQGWVLHERTGRSMQVGSNLVVALGTASAHLLKPLGHTLRMQAVRGQLSLGPCPNPVPATWPKRPRNGDGSLLPAIPWQGLPHWMVGSSFDRSLDLPVYRPEDQDLNAQRWQRLAADSILQLPPQPQWGAWVGVRATVPDRLPWVGPLPHRGGAGLWVLAGLGARGLTLGSLCGELLAAQITRSTDAMPQPLRAALSSLRSV
ncbi:MAG: FAD-dependent 5-carboxymethylaminomethyl-2-thiouridine(34) oxidoreductase MnmC [Alphaproteobacteria bacterium]|nr:FAD-dependent 5-carboxymethylaminomethyl-2-thiouridine(34) oxidoreductase MnmC [Alphaproteobacteria bacterium]